MAVRPPPYRGDTRCGEIELLEEGPIFQNAYVEVFNDRVRFPARGGAAGNEGTSFRWRWAAPYGVVVLPRLPDGSLLLIEIFRHTERGWRLEAPRGFGASDQSPDQAARREVLEETGHAVLTLTPVRPIGASDYPVHLFIADITAEPVSSQTDEDEAIRACHRFGRDQRPALLADTRIHDAETLFLISVAG